MSSKYKSYKNLLSKLIAFKSVSTSDEFQQEIDKTAEWLGNLFEENGFEVEVIRGYDNPVVFASFEVDSEFETALVYGHYDVQPASQSDGWDSDPFELTERDGRLFARGVVDNKGQVLVHIKTIIDLIEEDNLQYNVKFLIEGNEETGSPNLITLLEDKKDLLKCDFVMISDGEITSGHPTIEAGFRGGFNTTLTVRTSDKELHSGLFGGAAPSASRELSKFLAQIHKEDNTVAIEGFYDDVDEISAQYKQMHNQIPFSEEEFKKLSGTQALLTEDQYDFYTQIGLRPAVIITGIQTGYMGEGYRNSIPSEASAKVNFRLVKSQEPEKISQLYCDFVDEHIPDYVDFDLRVESKYHGIKLDLENEYVQLAQEYLQKAFDKESFFKFCGGGLPIVTHFDEVLGVPEVLAPLANEDCAMHATNENYNKNVLKRALKFSKVFWSKS